MLHRACRWTTSDAADGWNLRCASRSDLTQDSQNACGAGPSADYVAKADRQLAESVGHGEALIAQGDGPRSGDDRGLGGSRSATVTTHRETRKMTCAGPERAREKRLCGRAVSVAVERNTRLVPSATRRQGAQIAVWAASRSRSRKQSTRFTRVMGDAAWLSVGLWPAGFLEGRDLTPKRSGRWLLQHQIGLSATRLAPTRGVAFGCAACSRNWLDADRSFAEFPF